MIVEVVAPSATIEVGAAVISEVVALATPGVNVTVSVSVIAAAFTVPVIFAVPVVVEVNVAVCVPLLLSVTEPKLPRSVASSTVSPPLSRLLLFKSVGRTVIVEGVAPWATIEESAAVISEVVAFATQGVNVTVSVAVISAAFTVPLILAVAVVVEFYVAVCVPLLLSVTEPKLPESVASVTVSPPLMRSLLLVSFSWTVIVDVATPSATIEVGAAVISDVVASAAPAVNVTVSVSVIAAAFTVPVIVAGPAVVPAVSVAV